MAAIFDLLPGTPIAKTLQTPKVPKLKPVPNPDAQLRERLSGRGGEASTNITGGRGVTGGQVFKRKLGG